MVKFFVLLMGLVFSLVVFGEQTSGFNRGYRLGISQNNLIADGIEGTVKSGPGLIGVYEFNLTPRFTIGIDLEYRTFADVQEGRKVGQLGYGLLLKHSFPRGDANASLPGDLTPYLEYGLLMNVTRIAEFPRAGTSHDTRLAVGADFEVNNYPVFADLSYHYSKLDYFSQPRIDLSYLQFCFGWRWQK
ncbi:MAG: hypothetical protein RJB66_1658 [Pseudomonadota bacterium]|jgi:hypothetical protein